MSDQKHTYHLACHCQKHVLRFDSPGSLVGQGVCDCSHCIMRRIIWQPAPAGSLEVVRGCGKDGSEELVEYRFGSKSSAHQFCGTCGTHLLGSKFDPAKEVYLNLRAIRDKDLNVMNLPLELYSGIDRKPDYKYVQLADIPGAKEYLQKRQERLEHATEIYAGSCHCQAVKFAAIFKRLDQVRLMDCGCSICVGNGVLWVYPERRDIYFYPNASPSTPHKAQEGLLSSYAFHQRTNIHYFCKTCGINVLEHTELKDRPADYFEKGKVMIEKYGEWDMCGINAALLSDMPKYLGDLHGLTEEQIAKGGRNGVGFERLQGVKREPEEKYDEPVYVLNL